jgi:hypothetical protein
VVIEEDGLQERSGAEKRYGSGGRVECPISNAAGGPRRPPQPASEGGRYKASAALWCHGTRTVFSGLGTRMPGRKRHRPEGRPLQERRRPISERS